MAETLKNFRAAMTTGGVTAYTCPTGTTAVVIHLQVVNVDGTNSADATVHWTDASASNAVTRLCSTTAVPADTAISVLIGKLPLAAGDTIVAIASANSDLELSGGVLEIT